MKTQAPEIDRLAQISSALLNTARSTDALRLQLWFEVSQNLGLPDRIPLSLRGIKSAAAALGVRAAELLKPSVLAARVTAAGEDTSTAIKFGRKLLRVLPKGLRSSRDENVSFQDVAAAELKALMDKLSQADLSGTVDPEVAAAIQKGRTAISTVAVAAGGWAAFASAVGSAGFAPFIAAAQLSAVIPFVSGPALVSFLAVMTNPVTVVAGTAALGYWAIKGQSVSARETAAARVAILLAVRGLQDQDTGIAALASVLRRGHRLTEAELSHMSRNARDGLILRGRQIERRLSGEIPSPASSAPGTWGIPIKRAALPTDLDVGVVAGLTAGDMLYHAAAIDPAVLKAADFSRLLELDSPLDLAAHVESFAAAGAQIAVRGYTAEQLVMASLVEQGHIVELAASSTMPGYDLLVDGNAVQVKCGASLSLLHEHFSRYPDIPVIADADLARMAEASGEAWAQLVSSVEGFDLGHVQSILDRSLSAAEALGQGVVPVYAVIVGSARAASKAWAGEIPIEELPAWLVLDLAVRGGLSSVGQIGGAFVGLLMIGPAGALVIGPVVGIAALFGTSQLHGLLDRAIRNPWHASVMETAGRLRRALVNAGNRRLDMMLERQFRLRDSSQTMPIELISWLDRRMADDVIHVWEILDGYGPVSTLRDAIELLIHASAIGMADPDVLAARRQLTSLIEAKPSTMASLRQVGEKITTLTQSIPRRG
ncbi:MAG: hypothetical protein U1A24_16160 [Cypionkella sp.]|uniref:hypothetical protein n=1 Tax=Cypionkella sp. TaxID=2811411 RepID=UPI002ABC3CF0|nr:hypothetical protein [Cypionkella sp.]MDZ4312082.1 hypothetical protein [Cypionkella sp.]